MSHEFTFMYQLGIIVILESELCSGITALDQLTYTCDVDWHVPPVHQKTLPILCCRVKWVELDLHADSKRNNFNGISCRIFNVSWSKVVVCISIQTNPIINMFQIGPNLRPKSGGLEIWNLPKIRSCEFESRPRSKLGGLEICNLPKDCCEFESQPTPKHGGLKIWKI